MAFTGVKIWSLNPVYNWASPDEDERQHQVRNFRRTLEIAEELEVPLIATEYSGDPNQPVRSENQFYRSMEELIPEFEKRGLECTIEAHPYDFVETNDRKPWCAAWLSYQCSASHTCSTSTGARRCARALRRARLRLTWRRVRSTCVGNRYIINPPGVDARIHQHNGRQRECRSFSTRARRGALGVCLRLGGERRRDPVRMCAASASGRVHNELTSHPRSCLDMMSLRSRLTQR